MTQCGSLDVALDPARVSKKIPSTVSIFQKFRTKFRLAMKPNKKRRVSPDAGKKNHNMISVCGLVEV